MGLVKAVDVEYMPLVAEDIDEYSEFDEDDSPKPEDYGPYSGEVNMLAPIIIGGQGIDFDTFTFAPEALEHLVFFTTENTEVTMGEPIIIGRARELVVAVETPDFEEDAYTTDFNDDYSTEETFEEESGDTEPQALKDFSSGLAADAESGAADAEAWAMQRQSTMIGRIDDKVRQMMDEQKLALRAESQEQISFVSEAEKQKLLKEAMQSFKASPQAAATIDMESVFSNIADFIDHIALNHRERLMQELDEERTEMTRNVEEYVENTLHMQREEMMKEASDYIATTVKEYKQQLNEDNEFIKAANQLIAQREEILDDAYNKSLSMVQEAEAEASRAMEEAYNQQEQANQLVAEAEAQSEMITQEAQSEAERIISEANMESARIIEAAEQSHQEIVEAATQDGFNVGYQEGREEAIKENAQLLMETTNALNKLHAAFPMAVRQNEDKLIKLAVEIARDVIQEELSAKPEICLKALGKAISKVSDLEKVLIKVNPLDLDIVLPKQEYFKRLLPDVQDFVITGHYSIERGGCFIETNSGSVDAQIGTQLAVVEEVFQQIRSEYDFGDEDDMQGDE